MPNAAGGSPDTILRIVASRLSELTSQQFIVDNRAGGGAAAALAFALVAKANPDGYTLLAIIPSFTFSPALYRNYPVDPVKDFAPVSLLTRAPYLLVVNASVAVKSARELIALARSQPGKLNFGAGNTGSGTHLVTMWFMSAAGVKALYVPYRSVGLAMLDLAGGRLDATLANVLSATHYVRTGKLRALGISTAQRSPILPDLPTIAEQGAPGFNASTFHGYAAPAGTPVAIVNKLSREFARAVKAADVADKLSADGGEPVGSTPQEFSKLIADEIVIWHRLVRESGVKVE